MSDRFKFRIWHEPLKQMHYNDFIVTATGYMAKIYQQDDYMMKFNQEDLEFDKQCILMQSTGLKDKNGKLIYEGDIVTFEKSNNTGKLRKGVVKYYIQYCWFFVEVSENKWARPFNTIPDRQYLEVIGNIYENKELLEEECQK